jgi:hypothetical protein
MRQCSDWGRASRPSPPLLRKGRLTESASRGGSPVRSHPQSPTPTQLPTGTPSGQLAYGTSLRIAGRVDGQPGCSGSSTTIAAELVGDPPGIRRTCHHHLPAGLRQDGARTRT